jgi:hypothetical protein
MEEEDPTPSPTVEPGDMSRRSLLGKAAVGAAVAWTAPVVLAVPASAEVSCTEDEVNWQIWEFSLNDLANNPFDVPVGATGTMSVSFDDSNMGAGTATPGYAQVVPLGGFVSDFISIEMSASAPGEYSTITFAFDEPVLSLTFTLLDVDRGIGDAWQDEVMLEATFLGTPVVLDVIDYTYNPAYVAHQDVFSGMTKVADLFRGIDEAPNNTSLANVTVTYDEPIDTLVISYLAGAAALTPQPQQVGITDFLYCM